MAGTYTQRREIPGVGKIECVIKNPNGSIGYSYEKVRPGRQTTTSFRTGRGESLAPKHISTDPNKVLREMLEANKPVTFDNGHEFSTEKTESFVRVAYLDKVFPDGSSGRYPWVPDQWLNSLSYPQTPAWTSKNADGNLAIKSCYPTAPKASLAQTVIELKNEGLPSLFGTQIASMKGKAAQAIGSEVLNHQFGWVPLISDLDKILKAVVNSSKILQQMERDSGRVVRRRYGFPVKTELVESSRYNEMAKAIPSSASPLYGQIGPYTVDKTRTTRIWFSGAFTYYIDPGKNLIGQAIRFEQLANQLLGTRITPDTLWNLAPWSWLADWFANIGNNITVASAFQNDGLTLKYGYLMREVISSDMYTFSTDAGSPKGISGTSQLILRTTSKERVKASPFGFGITQPEFNSRQWAVLGALGMTQGPQRLR